MILDTAAENISNYPFKHSETIIRCTKLVIYVNLSKKKFNFPKKRQNKRF